MGKFEERHRLRLMDALLFLTRPIVLCIYIWVIDEASDYLCDWWSQRCREASRWMCYLSRAIRFYVLYRFWVVYRAGKLSRMSIFALLDSCFGYIFDNFAFVFGTCIRLIGWYTEITRAVHGAPPQTPVVDAPGDAPMAEQEEMDVSGGHSSAQVDGSPARPPGDVHAGLIRPRESDAATGDQAERNLRRRRD